MRKAGGVGECSDVPHLLCGKLYHPKSRGDSSLLISFLPTMRRVLPLPRVTTSFPPFHRFPCLAFSRFITFKCTCVIGNVHCAAGRLTSTPAIGFETTVTAVLTAAYVTRIKGQ